MDILEYCQKCKKETPQFWDKENHIIECYICRHKEDLIGKKVYPVCGEPAD